jgi:hypothetical protein
VLALAGWLVLALAGWLVLALAGWLVLAGLTSMSAVETPATSR